jgi:hypothetical protein
MKYQQSKTGYTWGAYDQLKAHFLEIHFKNMLFLLSKNSPKMQFFLVLQKQQ